MLTAGRQAAFEVITPFYTAFRVALAELAGEACEQGFEGEGISRAIRGTVDNAERVVKRLESGEGGLGMLEDDVLKALEDLLKMVKPDAAGATQFEDHDDEYIRVHWKNGWHEDVRVSGDSAAQAVHDVFERILYK
jgi:hypothetical protein